MTSTKQYCLFFNGLTDDLQENVKTICKNAEDKSKIYSNIENEFDILISDGDLHRSAQISTTFKTEFTTRLNNLKTQKDILDKVLKLYKQKFKINVDVDKNDYKETLLYTEETTDNWKLLMREAEKQEKIHKGKKIKKK